MPHRPVIFSLHPRWADLVFSGQKTIEVRRRFASPGAYPTLAFVHVTGKNGGVQGSVRLKGDSVLTVDDLAARRDQTQIPDADLRAYMGHRPIGIGIHLERPMRFETPVPLPQMRALGCLPPQLFSWLEDPALSALLQEPCLISDKEKHPDTWRVKTLALQTLDPAHPVFAQPRRLYDPAFTPWLAKCQEENRPAYGLYTKDNSLKGIAILAHRGQGRAKLCTFHTLSSNQGAGTFFMDRLLAHLPSQGVTHLHGELLTSSCETTQHFFQKSGFQLSPSPDKPCSFLMTISLG